MPGRGSFSCASVQASSSHGSLVYPGRAFSQVLSELEELWLSLYAARCDKVSIGCVHIWNVRSLDWTGKS